MLAAALLTGPLASAQSPSPGQALARLPVAPAPPPYPIWPIPREAASEKDRLILIDAVIVVPEGDARAQYPGRLLSELIQDEFLVPIPVVVGKAPAGQDADLRRPGDAQARLGRAPEDVIAREPRPRGLLPQYRRSAAPSSPAATTAARSTASSSFIQLVHRWGNNSVAVRKATVKDWPFLPVRWVHVYIPGKENLPFARRYMRDFLLRYKFNGMIMEVGGGMRFDSHPEINTGWERTVKEWYAHGETMPKIGEGIPLGPANRFAASCHFGVARRLLHREGRPARLRRKSADTYGLEIVPEVQSLSHVLLHRLRPQGARGDAGHALAGLLLPVEP